MLLTNFQIDTSVPTFGSAVCLSWYLVILVSRYNFLFTTVNFYFLRNFWKFYKSFLSFKAGAVDHKRLNYLRLQKLKQTKLFIHYVQTRTSLVKCLLSIFRLLSLLYFMPSNAVELLNIYFLFCFKKLKTKKPKV